MIKIQSLSVAYGDILAVEDVTLAVEASEILAVIGPNGAGKSTMMRAISGVLPIQAEKAFRHLLPSTTRYCWVEHPTWAGWDRPANTITPTYAWL